MTLHAGKIYTSVVKGTAAIRLDRYLTTAFPEMSRTFFKELIEGETVMVNERLTTRASTILEPGDVVTFTIPTKKERPPILPEQLAALGIEPVFEHDQFLVISKPAGIVVHKPHEKASEVTLVDWLLYFYPEIKQVGPPDRPGIVHRLDKDTSGLMLVARTPEAYETLTRLFRDREVKKTYQALVFGHPESAGTIDYMIARHATIPIKMAPYQHRGRDAVTHYTVIDYFDKYALLEAQPLTGRTHQIRVHCAAIGHPIVGDEVYGRKDKLIRRQALHAGGLSFDFNGKHFSFEKPIPSDFARALERLAPTKVKKLQ